MLFILIASSYSSSAGGVNGDGIGSEVVLSLLVGDLEKFFERRNIGLVVE